MNGTDMPDYLLDTNAVIYFFNGEESISKLINETKGKINISFITKIELLCFEAEDAVGKEIAEFVKEIEVLLINDEIITRTIHYHKNLKLKVPDAIIAATANVRDLILVTADRSLAQKVKELTIISPI